MSGVWDGYSPPGHTHPQRTYPPLDILIAGYTHPRGDLVPEIPPEWTWNQRYPLIHVDRMTDRHL